MNLKGNEGDKGISNEKELNIVIRICAVALVPDIIIIQHKKTGINVKQTLIGYQLDTIFLVPLMYIVPGYITYILTS